MERSLIWVGVGVTMYMAVLEILGTLGFHYANEAAIVIYYIVVSLTMSTSVVFSIYHARMRCRESIIV